MSFLLPGLHSYGALAADSERLPPPISNSCTLFCEDVRFEASNHLSLMGVTHQIVVPRLPVTMIKFAVVTHWRGEGQYLNEVRILAPDRMNRWPSLSRPVLSSRLMAIPIT